MLSSFFGTITKDKTIAWYPVHSPAHQHENELYERPQSQLSGVTVSAKERLELLTQDVCVSPLSWNCVQTRHVPEFIVGRQD